MQIKVEQGVPVNDNTVSLCRNEGFYIIFYFNISSYIWFLIYQTPKKT